MAIKVANNQSLTAITALPAAVNKKTSGKQKLKDLGLDDDEIKALIGV